MRATTLIRPGAPRERGSVIRRQRIDLELLLIVRRAERGLEPGCAADRASPTGRPDCQPLNTTPGEHDYVSPR
jgi:hypothetical protein